MGIFKWQNKGLVVALAGAYRDEQMSKRCQFYLLNDEQMRTGWGLSTSQIANDIHQSVFEIFSDGRWMDFLPLTQVLVAVCGNK